MEGEKPSVIGVPSGFHHGKTAPAVVLEALDDAIAVLLKAGDDVLGTLKRDLEGKVHLDA